MNLTIRHLVAQNKDEASRIILYALHSIGAKRCSKDIKDCTQGCSTDGTFNGTPFRAWPTYESETLYTKLFLDAVIQDARKRRPKHGKRGAKLICFDGGGVRGLITIQLLIDLQKKLKRPIRSYFNWFSGTSTGSFLASLFTMGKSPQEMRSMYFEIKDKLLSGNRPYSSETFEKIIKSVVGSERLMTDVKDVKLLITATIADKEPVELHLFRNYPSPADVVGVTVDYKGFSKPNTFKEQLLWSALR